MAGQNAVSLLSVPAAGQIVEHDGKAYETVREGRAFILVPPNTRTSVDPQAKAKADDGSSLPQNVFYNPIQQFNRDLSVLAIKAYGEDLCERRRVKRELQRPKQRAKKERKRKRNDTGVGEDAEEDGGVKLRKTEEGAARSAGEQSTAAGAANGGQVSHRGFEDSLTLSGDSNDVVPVPDAAESQDVTDGVDENNAEGRQPPIDGTSSSTAVDPQSLDVPQPWHPRFRILDALSATGLRALRYASEIPFTTSVTANDMDRKAVNSIKLNVEHNKLSSVIDVKLGNAMAHMYGAAFPSNDAHDPPHHVNGKYDVIDLDPYGTAAPFIDSALQALNDEGLLCVTCTDSGVFASCGYPEKTYSLYGGIPVRGVHSHEGGLRLILQSIASTAAKYGLAIEPLLSLSIDFYARFFIRVRKSPADVKFLAGKTMLVYSCDAGCGAWTTQFLGRHIRQTGKIGSQSNFKHSIAQAPSADRLCEQCGSKTHVAGPMWAGPLHHATFIENVLDCLQDTDKDVYQTSPRIQGMLDTALEELAVVSGASTLWRADRREAGSLELLPKTPPETLDLHPFFFIPSALSKVIHCQAPSEAAVKGALRHAGYIATRSHCKPGSVKTDAPWSAIWEIMREWVRQKSPIKEGVLKEGSAGWNIMRAARKSEEEPNSNPDDESASNPRSSMVLAERDPADVNGKPRDARRLKVVFDEVLGKDKSGKRLVRYQQNPREDWGPMARAKGSSG